MVTHVCSNGNIWVVAALAREVAIIAKVSVELTLEELLILLALIAAGLRLYH